MGKAVDVAVKAITDFTAAFPKLEVKLVGIDSDFHEYAAIAAVTDVFRDAGYRVGVNRPYANAIAPVGYRGHSLMIEISKRCYMDEAKLCKHEGFERCHECLERVYSTLLK